MDQTKGIFALNQHLLPGIVPKKLERFYVIRGLCNKRLEIVKLLRPRMDIGGPSAKRGDKVLEHSSSWHAVSCGSACGWGDVLQHRIHDAVLSQQTASTPSLVPPEQRAPDREPPGTSYLVLVQYPSARTGSSTKVLTYEY